jgi:hypothetical protein
MYGLDTYITVCICMCVCKVSGVTILRCVCKLLDVGRGWGLVGRCRCVYVLDTYVNACVCVCACVSKVFGMLVLSRCVCARCVCARGVTVVRKPNMFP